MHRAILKSVSASNAYLKLLHIVVDMSGYLALAGKRVDYDYYHVRVRSLYEI